MSEQVVIQLDLDSEKYQTSLASAERQTSSAADRISKSLDKGIVKKFEKDATIAVLNFNNSLISLNETLKLMGGAISLSLPILVLMEKRFRIIENALNKIGINLYNVLDRIEGVKDSIAGFATGEKSVYSLQIAFGKLLEEVGLVDSTMLSVLNSVDNVGVSAKRTADKFTGFLDTINKLEMMMIQLAPIIIAVEKKTGFFSKTIEKLGISIEEVKESTQEFVEAIIGFAKGERSLFNLKIKFGMLLKDLGLVNNAGLSVVDTLGDISLAAEGASSAVSILGTSALVLIPLKKHFSSITQTAKDLAKVFLGGKGFTGLTSTLGSISAVLYGMSEALLATDHAAGKAFGGMAKLAAILTGGVAAGIAWAVAQTSRLAVIVGRELTTYFDSAAIKFNNAERSLAVFNATVQAVNRSTGRSISSFEDWNGIVEKVADSFNMSGKEVRKAAQEILLVGPKIGLAEGQMKKLLKVSAEYAKVNQKDVFQTTVNMINALNGNAQAVTAYGIKLSQASVQQFLYKKGVTKTLDKMSEGEQVQERYNKLLKEYKTIAGIGAIAATTLADQQERLALNTERITTALGEGARIIEQNNLLAWAANSIIDNFGNTVFRVTGFLGALGARLLTVAGGVADLYFKGYLLLKIWKGLEVLLASDIGVGAFAKTIPVIGKSLNDLISHATGTEVAIRSLDDLLGLFATNWRRIRKDIAKFIFGIKPVKGILGGISAAITVLIGRVKSLYIVLAPLLVPLAKFIAIGALIAAVGYGIYKVFKEIEDRTKALTDMFKVFYDTIVSGSSIFKPFIDDLIWMKNELITLGNKAFGGVVVSAAKMFRAIAVIAKQNPLGVFSDESVAKLSEVDRKLSRFIGEVRVAGYDLRKLADGAGRGIANSGKEAIVNLEELGRKLNQIREDFKFTGMTDAEIIKFKEDENLQALELAFKKGLLAEQEYGELRAKIRLDALNKLQDIEDKKNKERNDKLAQMQKRVNSIVEGGFVRAISGGIQNLVKSIEEGKSVLEEFGSFIFGVFGDMAIQLGEFYIAQGIATAGLFNMDPTGTIAAGAGLVALGAILKGMAGRTGSGSGAAAGSVGGASTTGPSGEIGVEQILAEPEDIERQGPSTNIDLVVQGSLVQQEELGEYLVDTINENFEKKGLTLTDARFA